MREQGFLYRSSSEQVGDSEFTLVLTVMVRIAEVWRFRGWHGVARRKIMQRVSTVSRIITWEAHKKDSGQGQEVGASLTGSEDGATEGKVSIGEELRAIHGSVIIVDQHLRLWSQRFILHVVHTDYDTVYFVMRMPCTLR